MRTARSSPMLRTCRCTSGRWARACGRCISAQQRQLRAGDSWLLNSPYHGGTHLPDMTVVTPVFIGGGARPDFFVASRAHHADIGGMTPGSMPPFSRTIEEEGILFECLPLVSGGVLRERELLAALAVGAWPARRPRRTSPTCARSSPPTPAASPRSSAPCSATGWTPCTPTCGTCRRTPRECVRGPSRGCARGASATRWMTAR